MPKAFVVAKEGKMLNEDDLRNFCKGKIAHFKIPRVIEIRDELPHSPTGKILKKALK